MNRLRLEKYLGFNNLEVKWDLPKVSDAEVGLVWVEKLEEVKKCEWGV